MLAKQRIDFPAKKQTVNEKYSSDTVIKCRANATSREAIFPGLGPSFQRAVDASLTRRACGFQKSTSHFVE